MKLLSAITEEFYWLTQNSRFTYEIDRLRSNYGIPTKGFKSITEYDRWIKRTSLEYQVRLDHKTRELTKKCKLGKSSYIGNLIPLINSFLFFKHVPEGGIKPVKFINSLSVSRVGNFIKLEALLSYDFQLTKLKQQISDIKDQLKEVSQEIQKQRIKESPNFNLQKSMWEIYLSNNNPKETWKRIKDEHRYSNFTLDDVRKTISIIKQKVKRSFSA